MSHFAKIDENNIVVEVIVAEQDFIDSGAVGDPSKWIQTSYNTIHNTHPENRPLRKNFAAEGFYYDKDLDAFIPPKPYDSWVFDKEKCDWHPPIPAPSSPIPHFWDENKKEWACIRK
jgi:hypothetical protein